MINQLQDHKTLVLKKIFLISATVQYSALKLKKLKELNIQSIADDKSCLLFMWMTGPQFANSMN